MPEKKTTKSKRTTVTPHKTSKTGKNVSGVRAVIDKDVFEELCNIQCTRKEIASVFRCSESAISKWCQETYNQTFTDAFDELSLGGKSSLRRTQFELAKKSSAMAIFLGKQYLGQKDTPVEDDTEAIKKVSDILVSIKNVAGTQKKQTSKVKEE